MLRVVSVLPPDHGLGVPFDLIVLQHDERRLRRKLQGVGRSAPITTVRGIGYMFKAEVQRA